MDSRIREALQQTKNFIDAMSNLSYNSQFDGIANSFGKPPEETRDAIYKNITSLELRWVFKAYTSRIVQKARDDERRRCAECCIKILKLAREKIQDHVNEIYSSGGVEYIGLGSTLDEIDKVLKEFESNG